MANTSQLSVRVHVRSLGRRTATSADPCLVQLHRNFRIRHKLELVDRYSALVQLAERHSPLIIVTVMNL